MKNTRRAILSASLAAAAAATLGAAPPPPAKTERIVLRVPYWIDNAQPAPAGPVQAKMNGADARVLRQLGPNDDLLIVLVLDLAGDLSRVDPARDALIEAIRKLPPNVQVALLRAQDGLRVLQDPGAGADALISEIQSLNISGRAALLDTVESALLVSDKVLGRARVRVATFFVTDSLVGNYREDFTNPVVNSSDSRDMSRRFPEVLVKERIQQILARMGHVQAPLFIAHLNYENDRVNEAYQTGLLELANSTGGTAEFARTLGEIPTSVAKLVDAILTHSSVEIEFKPDKSRRWEVTMNADGQPIRHRTRFLPPGGKGQ